MFSMLDKESGYNYAAVLTALDLRKVPQPVKSAYAKTVRSRSRDAWNPLKRAFLAYPPGR